MMRPSARLALVAAIAASYVLPSLAQNACAFVPESFRCSLANSLKYALQCSCFSCNEIDGVGAYQCNAAVVCAASYTSTNATSLTPSWWLSAYVSVGIVFLVVSVLVYAALRVLARFTRVLHDDEADKQGSDADAPELRLRTRAYRYVYNVAFGTLYKADGVTKHSLRAFWIANCELFDCVYCCVPTTTTTKTNKTQDDGRGDEPDDVTQAQEQPSEAEPATDQRRPVYLRAARLLASLAVGASLAVMLGSLDFDKLKCRAHANVAFCSAANGGAITPETNVTTVICDDAPAIVSGATLVSASSLVAFVTTQCIKLVGSFGLRVGAVGSKLDGMAHALWLVVALIAFPVSCAVSSQLLSHGAYTYKDASLRVRVIVSVTLSTWIKDQVFDILKAPCLFVAKTLASKCFLNPHTRDKAPVVQPMPHALAPPQYSYAIESYDPADPDHGSMDDRIEKPVQTRSTSSATTSARWMR